MVCNDSAIGKTINIGTGNEISIGNLAELIIQMSNSKMKIDTETSRKRPPKSEVDRLVAENSLASNLIKWKPVYSLEKGLEATIKWFKENLDWYKPEFYAI